MDYFRPSWNATEGVPYSAKTATYSFTTPYTFFSQQARLPSLPPAEGFAVVPLIGDGRRPGYYLDIPPREQRPKLPVIHGLPEGAIV